MAGWNELMATLGRLANLGASERIAHALEDEANAIAQAAKDKLGTYQGATAGYPAWPLLSESTQAHHDAVGAKGPLKVSGQLYDDITAWRADGDPHTWNIGVHADAQSAPYALVQEMGSVNLPNPIPPRPFLRPAIAERAQEVVGALGDAIQADIR